MNTVLKHAALLLSWIINHAKLLHRHLRWKHGRANNTLADDEQEVVGVRPWSRTAAAWATALLRVRTPPPPAAAFSLQQWRPSCAAGYFTRLWRHLQAETGRRTFIVAANGGRLTRRTVKSERKPKTHVKGSEADEEGHEGELSPMEGPATTSRLSTAWSCNLDVS